MIATANRAPLPGSRRTWSRSAATSAWLATSFMRLAAASTVLPTRCRMDSERAYFSSIRAVLSSIRESWSCAGPEPTAVRPPLPLAGSTAARSSSLGMAEDTGVGPILGSTRAVVGSAMFEDLLFSCASDELAHGHGRVGHAVGEAPLVVIPRDDAHKRAV